MSNEHDIVLTLNSTTFDEGIKKATELLANLDRIAKGVNDTLKNVQTSLSGINLSSLTNSLSKVDSSTSSTNTQVNNLGKSVKALGDQVTGSSGQLDFFIKTIVSAGEQLSLFGKGGVTAFPKVNAAVDDITSRFERLLEISQKAGEGVNNAIIKVSSSKTKNVSPSETSANIKAEEFIAQNAQAIALEAKKGGVSFEELSAQISSIIKKGDLAQTAKLTNDIANNIVKGNQATAGFTNKPSKKQDDIDPKKLEAYAKAQEIVAKNFTVVEKTAKDAGVSIEKVTKDLAKTLVAIDNTKANTALKQFTNGLAGVGQEAKKTYGLFDFLQRGIEIGFSHAVGAISVGANVIRSIVHELVRNISISLFNFSLKTVKDQFDSTSKVVKASGGVIQDTLKNLGGQLNLFDNLGDTNNIKRASDSIAKLESSTDNFGGGFKEVFKSIDFGLAAMSIGFLVLGKLLDSLGDKVLALAENLAKISGESNLSFIQLNATIQATGESLNRSLGNSDKWIQFIRDLSIQSGRSQKDLSDFAISFVQVGAQAGLTGDQLQQLLRVAAFTGDRFRNSAEQLNNFRNALTGNFRPINTNIFLANDANDATKRYQDILVSQGKSFAEAAAEAAKASIAQKALTLLTEATIPIIETATETSGNYALELRKLKGAFENLKIAFGAGVEGAFAGATRGLRFLVDLLNSIPGPIKAIIGGFTLFSGIVFEVTARLFKLLGIIGLITVAIKVLDVALKTTFASLGGTLGQYISQFLQLNTTIGSTKDLFSILSTGVKNTFSKESFRNIANYISGIGSVTSVTKTAGEQLELFSQSAGGVAAANIGFFAKTIQSLKKLDLKSIINPNVGVLFSNIFAGLGIAIKGIISILPTLITYFTKFISFIGPLSLLAGSVYLLVKGFEKFNEEAKITENLSEIINTIFDTINSTLLAILPSIDGVTSAFATFLNILGLNGEATANVIRNMFSLQGIISIIAIGFSTLSVSILYLLGLIPKLIVQVSSLAERFSRFVGLNSIAGFFKIIKDGAQDASDAFDKSVDKMVLSTIKLVEGLANLGEVSDKEFTAIFKNLQKINRIDLSLDEKEIKKFNDSIKQLENKIDDLKAKGLGLKFGLDAENEAKKVAQLNEELRKFTEERKKNAQEDVDKTTLALKEQNTIFTELVQKKLKLAESGRTLNKEDEKALNNAKLQIQTLTGILNQKNKLVINPELPPEKVKELKDKIEELFGQELANKIQERFNKLIDEVIKAQESINDEIRKRDQSIEIEQKVIDLLNTEKLGYNDLIRKADQLRLIKQAEFDVDNKIANLQKELNKPREVALPEGQKKRILEEINFLNANKINIVASVIQDSTFKDISKTIEDIGKKADDLHKKFADEEFVNQNQLITLQQFNKNLNIGVAFAENERKIREKQLEIDKEINLVRRELDKLPIETSQESRIKLEEYLNKLLSDRNILLAQTKSINIAESNNKIKQSLIEINNSLNDQIGLIEFRNNLFQSGVLRGEFNKVTEQISALTSSLESFYKQKQDIERLNKQNIGIDPEEVDKITNSIKLLEDGLRELNFVKDIQDALNTVTGAIEDVLTNGVRAVLEGTQTIKDLFKNMASNIFLSLSKFFAQKAIDGIKEKFNELAVSIANSGLGQAVAKFFNIPVGNLGKLLGKVQTPQEKLTESVDQNIISQDNLKASIDNLAVVIEKRGISTTTPTNEIPTPIANPFPDFSIEDFNRFNQSLIDNFDKGIAATEPEIQSFVNAFFDDFSTNLGNGLTDIEPVVKEATGKLIESTKGLLEALGETVTKVLNVPTKANVQTTTPANGLADALPKNTVATDLNTDALRDNTLALRNLPSGAAPANNTPITTTQGNVLSTVLPPPKELPNLPTQEFADKFNNTFAQDFQTSLERIAPTLQFNIDDLTTKVESSFTSNIKQFYNTVTTGFRNFFFDLQTTVSSWLEKLKDMVAAGGTGGEGGKKKFDWAGLGISIAKAVGSVYSYGATNAIPTPSTGQQDGGLKKGYAGGGMIPGKPSAKDNTWTHVATGEYVTNSEAVKHYGTSIFDALNNMTLPKDFFDNISASGATSQITAASNSVQASNKQTGAWNAQIASTNERPINVTVIDKANKLDPAAFKMKPSEVTQIFVEGVRKDRVIRKVIHEDMKSGKA